MATQTALALTEIAKPLTKITIPIPEPKEHELLIKISVAGSKQAYTHSNIGQQSLKKINDSDTAGPKAPRFQCLQHR